MGITDFLLSAAALTALSGGIILAKSLDAVLAAHELSIGALEVFRDSCTSQGDLIVVNGAQQHRQRATKTARRSVTLGIILLLLSFLCTLGSIYTARNDAAEPQRSALESGAKAHNP